MKLTHEKRTIESPGGKRKTLLLRPKEQTGRLPGILWIHGGGYILGMEEMVYMSRAYGVAKRFAGRASRRQWMSIPATPTPLT